jgi:hypothetical protein
MAKKKLSKCQKLKKQNQRVARQRKKQSALLIIQKKIEEEQKVIDDKQKIIEEEQKVIEEAIEEENKLALEFCELVVSTMLNDKCLTINTMEDGGLNISDGFIELMFPYLNKLEAPSSIKEKAIDIIVARLNKIHYDMAMNYLPDAKEIAGIVAKRFNSGERSVELQKFVQNHCDASEYSEWEDLFWDITEDQGFTIDDYEALPR